jgi:hypothetical protein
MANFNIKVCHNFYITIGILQCHLPRKKYKIIYTVASKIKQIVLVVYIYSSQHDSYRTSLNSLSAWNHIGRLFHPQVWDIYRVQNWRILTNRRPLDVQFVNDYFTLGGGPGTTEMFLLFSDKFGVVARKRIENKNCKTAELFKPSVLAELILPNIL